MSQVRMRAEKRIILSSSLFFFYAPPSKSTEAVHTCLCSGGARFKSLPIQ